MSLPTRAVLFTLVAVTFTACGSDLSVKGVFRVDDPTRSDGTALGGTLVKVKGSSFTGGTEVLIDGKPLRNKTLLNSGTIRGETPPQASLALGLVKVKVSNGDDTATKGGAWTYTQQPLSYTGTSPDFGSPTGGTSVTITGDGFAPGTTVEFQTAPPALLQNTVVVDRFTIRGDAPPSPGAMTGPVDILITSPWDMLTATNAYRYVACADPALPVSIAAIAPTSGPVSGGTRVRISGEGLVAGVEVTFGTEPATNPDYSRAPCSVEVDTPAAAVPGAVDVTVTNPANLDTDTATGGFLYTGVSGISVAPNVGPVSGGTRLLIGGGEFVAPTQVLFDGAEGLAPNVIAPTLLEVVAPPAAAPGFVDLVICNAAGDTVLLDAFEYLPVAIDSIAPNHSALAGGGTLQIVGSGLASTNRVLLGPLELTGLTVDTTGGTSVSGTIPAGLAPGAIDVTIQMTGQPPAIISDGFVYVPAQPIVRRVTPAFSARPGTDPATAGDEVYIEGDDFTTAPIALQIEFDGGGGGDDTTADTLVVMVQDTDILSTKLIRVDVPDKATGSNNAEVCEVGASNSVGSSSTADAFAYAEWTSPGLPTSDVRAIVGPDSNGDLFAAVPGDGVYTSVDLGATWTLANGSGPNALGSLEVQSLALAPATDDLYAGTSDMGVFLSPDAGGTWTAESGGLAGAPDPVAAMNVTSIAVTPGVETDVYIGTAGAGVWKTTGGGTPGLTWVEQPGDPGLGLLGDGQVQALAVSAEIQRFRDPVSDPGQTPYPLRLVVAGTATGGLFTSADGGASWQARNTGLGASDVRALAVGVEQVTDPADPTRQVDNFFLYAGTSAGVARGVSAVFVVDDPQNPGTFIAALQDVSWRDRSSGLGGAGATAVTTSAGSPSGVLAGTGASGVYGSGVAGCSWWALDPGATLSNPAVHDLLIVPDAAGAGSTVLAATGGGGVNLIRIVQP